MKQVVTLLALVILIYPQNNAEDFDRFVAAIPEIKTPLVFRYGYEGPIFDEPNIRSVLKPYTSASYKVVGKLRATDNYFPILFVGIGNILWPYLYTYTLKGEPIDSLYLHATPLMEGPEGISSLNTRIDKDLLITMQDTIFIPTGKEQNNKSIDSVFAVFRQYNILHNGRFNRSSDDKKYLGLYVRYWN